MMRPRTLLAALALASLATLLPPSGTRPATAQAPADAQAEPGTTPGKFFSVVEPITDATVAQLKEAVLPYLGEVANGKAVPVLVFEFRPGDEAPGRSTFGACHELVDFLAYQLNTTEKTKVQTVAYVPEKLSGYAVMGALACDEIVMGPRATLGPIAPEGNDGVGRATARTSLKELANRKGREPLLPLFLGMLDKDLEVRRVQTADGSVRYVLGTEMDAFKKEHSLTDDQPAWEAGNRGVLGAEQARGGLVRRLVEDRNQVKEIWNLASTADHSAAEPIAHSPIEIQGRIDSTTESLVRYELGQAVNSGANRVFLYISSEGGDDHAVSNIVDHLTRLPKSVVTVAYIEDRATGRAALIPLACDEIVFAKKAVMGNVVDPNVPDDANKVTALAQFAEDTAAKKGHPRAIAYAMVDPQAVVVEAQDTTTAAVVRLLETEARNPRYQVLRTIKAADDVLKVDSNNAQSLGMATRVVESRTELLRSFGVKGNLRIAQATWVHKLANTLNQPMVSGLLLFIGLFMLILELKLPGVGLPAIISALAFLLFFWSHYLGGTADQLEILLFLVGLVCLALELFVFPGFAVFGISGILLILVSVVMASHTFVWPTQEYEYKQMGQTLMQVTGAIITVTIAAVIVGRYLPSLPLFRRMVLVPEPLLASEDPTMKPSTSGDPGFFYLLGEVGRTTTALKPTGKARFGEVLVDVTADGFFIDPNSAVEVIEVRGSRVIVKKA